MCEGCEERIHVGHQVHRIDRSISKLLEMRVKEEGLDEIALMHGWILRYLYEHQDKEIYQKDIEKYFGICRSAVTNIIQTLEKKGYICRASVANDARLKKVMLTEKGRENHEKLGEIFQKMDAQLEEGFTEEELHAFLHVIDKVYYNMEKMKGDIVTGTLDALNSKSGSSGKSGKDAMSQTYEFSKSVLSAAYEAKGIAVNSKG